MSRVSLAEVRRFCIDCMTAVGTLPAHAVALADVLIEADRRGHYSHGINRLDMYVRDVKSKTCEGTAVPTVLKESPATAWVDGNNALGPVVGNFCMEVAMKKAKDCGVGWVVAKGSNHYGIAAWYSMQALKCNMLRRVITVSYGRRGNMLSSQDAHDILPAPLLSTTETGFLNFTNTRNGILRIAVSSSVYDIAVQASFVLSS